MAMECEHIFCHREAVARLTVPLLKPRQYICEHHLSETLKWAEPYRQQVGRIVIEREGNNDLR